MDATDAMWEELAARAEGDELSEAELASALDEVGLVSAPGIQGLLRVFTDRFWDLLQADPGRALAHTRLALAVGARLETTGPLLRAELERRRGTALYALGRMSEAEAAARLGLEQQRDLDPMASGEAGRTRAALLGLLGNARLARGDVRQALIALEEAIALARAHELRGHLGTYLTSLGNTRLFAGDTRSAEEYYEEALELARQHGNKEGAAVNLGNLGLVQHTLGNLEAAQEAYEEALGKARELGDRRNAAALEANAGSVLVERGDLDGAERRLEAALTLARGLGDRQTEALTLQRLAGVSRERGRLDQADALLAAAEGALAETADSRRSAILDERGRVCLQRHDADAAGGFFQQALAAARETGDRRAEAVARFDLGRAAAEERAFERALSELDSALTLADEVDEAALRASIEVARAEALLALGDSASAARALTAATRAEEGRPLFAGYLALARAAAMVRGDPAQARSLLHETSTRALRSGYAALAEEARRRLAALTR